MLQAQTLDAETKKLSLGASTIYNEILAERDLVTAQSNLVAAEAAYAGREWNSTVRRDRFFITTTCLWMRHIRAW